jgi:alkylation response protein AidB-like acyl-CoA dehydrogenase
VVESGAFYWNRQFGGHVDTQAFIRELVEYVKDTRVNGQSLSRNTLVRSRLAELAVTAEAVRLHTYRLAWAFDNNLDITGWSALTKFQSDRLGIRSADIALEITGPYGQLGRESGYAPMNGAVDGMIKAGVLRSFSTTGPGAMPSVIAGYILGLHNEFGLIY